MWNGTYKYINETVIQGNETFRTKGWENETVIDPIIRQWNNTIKNEWVNSTVIR